LKISDSSCSVQRAITRSARLLTSKNETTNKEKHEETIINFRGALILYDCTRSYWFCDTIGPTAGLWIRRIADWKGGHRVQDRSLDRIEAALWNKEPCPGGRRLVHYS